MLTRLFVCPLLCALFFLTAFTPSASAEDEFSFAAPGAEPLLRIAYTATSKGEMHPCPT